MPIQGKEYALSVRKFSGEQMAEFGNRMTPFILNALRKGATYEGKSSVPVIARVSRIGTPAIWSWCNGKQEFIDGRDRIGLALNVIKN